MGSSERYGHRGKIGGSLYFGPFRTPEAPKGVQGRQTWMTIASQEVMNIAFSLWLLLPFQGTTLLIIGVSWRHRLRGKTGGSSYFGHYRTPEAPPGGQGRQTWMTNAPQLVLNIAPSFLRLLLPISRHNTSDNRSIVASRTPLQNCGELIFWPL